jgi:LPS-assembly protein
MTTPHIPTDAFVAKMCCKQTIRPFIFLLVWYAYISFFVGIAAAEIQQTVLTSDHLDYFSETEKIVASGTVKIVRGDTVLQADRVILYNNTSDIIATGNVRYDDMDISLSASKAELNLKTKTGKLYHADLLHKKDNYRISADEIEKRGEQYYYSPEARFTTCDAPVPAWCFRGKKVHLRAEEGLSARNASFAIKNIPVLYSPYVWVPFISERKTGFLLPSVGYSTDRGLNITIPFFWAIAEDRDATIILDSYSKRGIGKGLEYRFVRPGDVTSTWWAYHIRDTKLKKNFWEIRALHEHRRQKEAGGFLSINYVNRREFYDEFNPRFAIRTQRFLESTGEINSPFQRSRLYLLSQYWVDLKFDTGDVPQRLPEIGYILNFTRMKNMLFSASVTASNMWRDNGLSTGRLDIYPQILFSTGKDAVLSQRLALRGTAYEFYKMNGFPDNSVQRLAFEYDVVGQMRLMRTYRSFTHIVEPSLRYHFIYSSENDLPVFDSTELFRKTSRIELSLLNRFMIKGSETATVRITQAYDAELGDRPFLPLSFEAKITSPLPLRIDADYNVHTGRLDAISSAFSFKISEALFSFGQRYNRTENILTYTTHVKVTPHKSLEVEGGLWYDAKEEGLQNLHFIVRYLRQCWGMTYEFHKKPDDYSMTVKFALKGFN